MVDNSIKVKQEKAIRDICEKIIIGNSNNNLKVIN